MKEVVLTGVDGSQLLGFLGALGVLDILAGGTQVGSIDARLGWRDLGTWRPVISGIGSVDEIAERVMADASGDLVTDLLGFRYLKLEKRGIKEVNALTPPVAVFRAWLAGRMDTARWPSVRYGSALMCETAADAIDDDKACNAEHLAAAEIPFDQSARLSESTLPTPFDFTSRNAQFLDQLRHIRDVLSTEVIKQELLGGIGATSDRIMRWDTLSDLPGALFGRVRSVTRPGAEWLAFRGISYFHLSGRRRRIAMPGLTGRRKAGTFSWVLWDGLLSPDVIRSTLVCASLFADPDERKGRGCPVGFTVDLTKDATGYDGSVSPSRPITD